MLVFLVVIGVTAITLQWTVRNVWQHTLHSRSSATSGRRP